MVAVLQRVETFSYLAYRISVLRVKYSTKMHCVGHGLKSKKVKNSLV
ncbi:unnamed protein product [Linum tenue]|uniref:Uncharacterized protein n=1 Tax=Linum tenue TaxID=586396 RepID=A0AAV0Q911_9ROSI|nr:unnamed protein product [Linum tenue]